MTVNSKPKRHKVAGSGNRPIIDLSGKWVTSFMGSGETVTITDSHGQSFIRKSGSNKGNRRIWIEGTELTRRNLIPGTPLVRVMLSLTSFTLTAAGETLTIERN